MPLKELEARYATKRATDYKLADGEGMYLLVRPNGSKLWRMKYRFDGKEKLLSLGRYPDPPIRPALNDRPRCPVPPSSRPDDERQVMVELVHHHMGERGEAGPAARDRLGRRRRLDDPFARPAAVLGPHGAHDAPLHRHHRNRGRCSSPLRARSGVRCGEDDREADGSARDVRRRPSASPCQHRRPRPRLPVLPAPARAARSEARASPKTGRTPSA